MKGIIFARGTGSRLFLLSQITSKQLLPIFDRPMIYCSLLVLLLAKIKDIEIISNEEDKDKYIKLVGDG